MEMPKRVRRLEKDGKMLNVNEGRQVDEVTVRKGVVSIGLCL